MLPGRELDVVFAKKMGWTEIEGPDHHGSYGGKPPELSEGRVIVPNFSSDIQSAFVLIEFLRKEGHLIMVGPLPRNSGDGWICTVAEEGNVMDEKLSPTVVIGVTPSIAICLAAARTWKIELEIPSYNIHTEK